MTDKELDELQHPDEWEWDDPQQVVVPPEHRRTVVSVSLRRDQSEIIAEAAERAGEKVSEFIRNAALERAKHRNQLHTVRVDTSEMHSSGAKVLANVKKRRFLPRILAGSLS